MLDSLMYLSPWALYYETHGVCVFNVLFRNEETQAEVTSKNFTHLESRTSFIGRRNLHHHDVHTADKRAVADRSILFNFLRYFSLLIFAAVSRCRLCCDVCSSVLTNVNAPGISPLTELAR